MKMNRRKALIGIGSLAVGSGAALGSGAFTQVEANRDVTVETAGDASAFLSLTGQGGYVTDNSSGGVITLDLGGPSSGTTGFNEDAVTQVADIVEVNQNAQGSNGGVTVGFGESSASSTYTVAVTESDGSGGTTTVGQVNFQISSSSGYSDSPSTVDLSTSSPAYIDAEIDTTVGSATSTNEDNTLDIYATTQ